MRRATRRHHSDRMKNKARKIAERMFSSYPDEEKKKILIKNYMKNADNMCVCSCCGCGNPRKHFKHKTKQELKNKEMMDVENQ